MSPVVRKLGIAAAALVVAGGPGAGAAPVGAPVSSASLL